MTCSRASRRLLMVGRAVERAVQGSCRSISDCEGGFKPGLGFL
jgi:hypothetical protein